MDNNLKQFLDTFPGYVVVLSATGTVEHLNQELLRYVGKTIEELAEWSMTDAVPADELPRVMETVQRHYVDGTPFTIEHRCRRADGVYRWFQVRAHPVRDADGVVTGWYELLTDIDDLKRAEYAVRQSERDLALIVDTIPAMTWTARPDGSAEFFNRHYLDFVGLTAEQASGWGWTTALHPDDAGTLATVWRGTLASGSPGEAEARLRRHDGAYRWFLFRTSPLRDAHGRIVRWYGVNTDIEDRKRAEAEVRRAHDSFAEAQRLSKTGSFVTDLVGDQHTWSDETYRIFDFEPGTHVSVERIRALILPEDRPPFDAMIARALTGADVRFGFRIVSERGTPKHIEGVAHVVEKVEGRPMFVGALRDATEHRVAEEALDRARAELAHVARVTAMGALTASIAHEVNQPLAGIVTNASTCLRMLDAEPPNVEGARETARRTIRDGHRASDVIARLRALFTRKVPVREAVDLGEAVREVIALSAGELQRHRVILRPALADDLPPLVGDRVQLQQVVLNLLLNAAEAMSGVADRPRELTVSSHREGEDGVRLLVRDTGVGVDPDRRERLFDAFYTTKPGGMGIGLSVSRSIVERHGGRLWVEPNAGPGATFVLTLPAGDAVEAAEAAPGARP